MSDPRSLKTAVVSSHALWTLEGDLDNTLASAFATAAHEAITRELPVVLDLKACYGLGLGGCQTLASVFEALPPGKFHLKNCETLLARQLGLVGHLDCAGTPKALQAEQAFLRRAMLRHARVKLSILPEQLPCGEGWFSDVAVGSALIQFEKKLRAGSTRYCLEIDDIDTAWEVKVRHVISHSMAWRIGVEFVHAGVGREVLEQIGLKMLRSPFEAVRPS